MKKIDVEQLKEIQLSILDYTADFCEKNNIKYWLDCGTLLGAVRHKGYIPWDDDLDIGMLREDYDRFMASFNEASEKYKFICGENQSGFFASHGKILDCNTILYEPDENGYKLSVNIDVFVYDYAPENEDELKRMYDTRDKYRNLAIYQSISCDTRDELLIKRVLKKIIHGVLQIFPKDFFMRKLVQNARKLSSSPTNFVGNFTSFSRTQCSLAAFEKTVDIVFEGKMYKAPIGWEEWLSALYGDYMQLPPESKRVSKHDFVAYVKE